MMKTNTQRIAIIGAGLSGLVLARGLSHKHRVTVFEKSRGVGGRMATRYADRYRFDHGAQFFTARSRDFRNFLQPYLETGVVANWRAAFVEFDGPDVTASRQWADSPRHYVAVPGMNALPQALAEGQDIQVNTRAVSIERRHDVWTVLDERGNQLGEFDWVVVTAPAAQTCALSGTGSRLGDVAAAAHMVGCYALMLGFPEPLELPWQAALVRNADISWISINSSKPGRGAPFTLVVHSTNAWAEGHMGDESARVCDHMLAALSRVVQQPLGQAEHCALHRWRFANIDKQSGPRCFFDGEKKIAACGDWFVRGRVEAAYLSAKSLLDRFADVE